MEKSRPPQKHIYKDFDFLKMIFLTHLMRPDVGNSKNINKQWK